MGYTTVSLEYDSDLGLLTLNCPERRNAISPDMINELMLAFDELEQSQARVGIVTGAGKAFCSGMDLESLRQLALTSHFSQPQEPATEGMLDVAVRVLKGEAEKGTTPPQPEESALESSRVMAQL